jgi:transglutaminase-like putative cysteine protease
MQNLAPVNPSTRNPLTSQPVNPQPVNSKPSNPIFIMRFLLFLLLPFVLQSQDEPSYNAALIPASLRENADAVIRSQEITFTVSAPDEAVFKEKRVVTMLNNKSDYNKIVLYYSSFNKIGRIRGSIYDANGKFIRDIEKKETQDYSAISGISVYEDSRVRYLEVNHDKFPYTVVFDYEIKYRDLLYYDDWDIQNFNTAVEQASLIVVMPEEIKLYHKTLNIKLEPSITSDKGKRRYEWKVEKLPAIKVEPYSPSAYALLPQVLLSPETFKADGYTGSMASWKDFGQFQYELGKGRDELSPALKTKVRELSAGLKTDAEKIAVLYRYLQENTRYVSVQLGIGGWQPFDAQYVEKNKYGDCKALSNFMKALLKEAGITSYPVIIKAGDSFLDISEDFATSAFNHVILYVPSQETWLECTSDDYPPNYIGDFAADRNVLLVTPQGGKLARTPAYTPEENRAERRTEITVSPAGEAKITKKSVLHGPAHEWYRAAVSYLAPDELKKKMQEQNPLPQAYFTQLQVLPDKETPTARVEYAMDVPQFGSKAGKRFFLPINPVNPFTDVPPANDKRIHPVEVRQGFVEQDTIVLNFPEGFFIESIPAENTTLETEFGTYSSQIIRQEKSLMLVRRLEMKPVRLPAERYNDWRNFRRDVAKADAMKVVLVNKT